MKTLDSQNQEHISKSRWWALGALGFCLLVISIDMTVLNVALPTLARDLKATTSQLQWMVDAYTLVYASLVLLGGSLGDRFGRKRTLLLGLLIFGGTSAWSAFSGNANILIIARGCMGIGGALIMPGTLSLVANLFTGKERATAIGTIQGISGVGVVIGPLLGGFLLAHFSWGVIFLINVPVVLLAVPICALLVPESKDPQASRLDPVGALLSITGLFALLYGIIEAPAYSLGDAHVVIALLVAAILLASFLFWELHTMRPMLDIRMFRSPSFSAAILALTLASFGMVGALFFLTQYLQLVLGYAPEQAGLCFTPLIIGMILTAVAVSPFLDRRIGTKFTVTAGLLLVAGSIALFATLGLNTSYVLIAGNFFLLGASLGITMVPATNAIMSSIPLDRAGVASAAVDTGQETGNALGVAILGSILAASYQATMASTAAIQALPAPLRAIARDSIGGATVLATQLGGQSARAILSAAQSAFVEAIHPTVMVGAAVSCLGALVALVFLPHRVETPPVKPDQDKADTIQPEVQTV